jgi:hypothetical protein
MLYPTQSTRGGVGWDSQKSVRVVSRFVRATGYKFVCQTPICRHFRPRCWATIGPRRELSRLIGQPKVPMCRHFETRERRDSNLRPPA